MRRLLTAVAVVAALAAATSTAALARSGKPQRAQVATIVTVRGTEFHFTLSRSSAKAGKVTFVFINVGKITHDFKIAGKKTPMITRGKTARLVLTLKKGKYPYLCTVPGHAAAGMKGVFTVA